MSGDRRGSDDCAMSEPCRYSVATGVLSGSIRTTRTRVVRWNGFFRSKVYKTSALAMEAAATCKRIHAGKPASFRLIARYSQHRFHVIDPNANVIKIRSVKLNLKLILIIDRLRHRLQVKKRARDEKPRGIIDDRQAGFAIGWFPAVGGDKYAGV